MTNRVDVWLIETLHSRDVRFINPGTSPFTFCQKSALILLLVPRRLKLELYWGDFPMESHLQEPFSIQMSG